MTTRLIAVHGATGAQGAPVVRHLLSSGHRVRAIARNPRGLPVGAEPITADLRDTEALAAAYTDVHAVVVQLPLVFDATATAQAESVLAAVEKAGVARVVFNPGGPVPDRPVDAPFVDARVLLRSRLSEVVATVSLVAPAAVYYDNLVGPWSAPLVAAGTVPYPLPAEAPVPWVASDDVAAVIAEMSTQDTPASLKLVAGPEDLTGAEVAAGLTAALDRPIRWRTITPHEYEQLLRPHLDDGVAAGIAAAYEPAPVGVAAAAGPDPTTVRRGPTSLREWAVQQRWPASEPFRGPPNVGDQPGVSAGAGWSGGSAPAGGAARATRSATTSPAASSNAVPAARITPS